MILFICTVGTLIYDIEGLQVVILSLSLSLHHLLLRADNFIDVRLAALRAIVDIVRGVNIFNFLLHDLSYYRIAGKFGEELNLPIWQSQSKPPS